MQPWPNALTSRAYARDFNEIKSLGALCRTTRTADQTHAAISWQEPIFALFNASSAQTTELYPHCSRGLG